MGKHVWPWLKNQPWNLKPISPVIIKGVEYSSRTVHLAVHGRSRKLALSLMRRLHYATPTWAKALFIGAAGRTTYHGGTSIWEYASERVPGRYLRRGELVGKKILPESN